MAKKQPGANLEGTLKESLESMNDDELKAKVSVVALLRQAIQQQMKKDMNVKQTRAELSEQLAPYKEDIKGANEQIEYISYLLEARGKL